MDKPDDVQRRLEAISIATRLCSDLRPRWLSEQAVEEIRALAEKLIDDSYGGRAARLQAMPYKEYLQTPEWREKRRAAYRRADYRCQLCNASGTAMHAHHRCYENRAKKDEEHDLIALCASCHERVHAIVWQA